MYPDIVTIADLEQSSIKQTNVYTVGRVQRPIDYLTERKEWVGKFDGLNALFDYQKQYQPTPKRNRSSDGSKAHEGGNFYYFDNFSDALEVYRNNPAKITNFKQSDVLIEGGESSGRELIYDVTGDVLDIGRYLSGEPEVFGSLTNGNPRNKRVSILLALSWAANITQDVINERAAQVVRLVDWLESQNIRTQVVGVNSNTCCHLEVIAKHFDEALNINDIGIVSHSDFLRRIIFRITEYSDTYAMGYGKPTTLGSHWDKHPDQYASEFNDEYTLLIDGGRTNSTAAVKQAFQLLELDLLKSLSEDEPSKVFKVL